MSWAATLVDPNAPDAAYANKPRHSDAVMFAHAAEITRLENLLLEAEGSCAVRCPKCERVIDMKDSISDDIGASVACWLCERE